MLYFPNLLASYTALENYLKDGRVQKANDYLVHTVSLSQTKLEIFSSIATYKASSQVMRSTIVVSLLVTGWALLRTLFSSPLYDTTQYDTTGSQEA